MRLAIHRLRRLEALNTCRALDKQTGVELWFETVDGHARNYSTGEILQMDALLQSGRNYLLFSEADSRV
jgi:hypothetical protein